MTKITQASSRISDDSSSPEYIKKYSKHMLKNSVFMGTFQEKRFVEPLNSYRDVITVCQDEEDFINNLLVVKRRINESFLKQPWMGVTEPDTVGAPVGYNLWVELSEEVFGKYWYKVKTVEFLENEIRLKLDIIRPVKQEHSPMRTSSSNADQSINTRNIKEYFEDMCEVLKLNFLNFCTTAITLENLKQSVIFISLLIGTIITGGISIIQYLLEYILKLIREVSFIIKAVSPIIISFINLIGKSIFGFYSMIVALNRDKSIKPPVYNMYLQYDPQAERQLQYTPNYRRPLDYYPIRNSRSGVVITPLD